MNGQGILKMINIQHRSIIVLTVETCPSHPCCCTFIWELRAFVRQAWWLSQHYSNTAS